MSQVTKVMSHIIEVHKKSDPKKGSAKHHIHKKGVREAKSLGTSGLEYANVFAGGLSAEFFSVFFED